MKKPSIDALCRDFDIIQDTREQEPFKFNRAIVQGLPFGDYTIVHNGKNYINEIVCERKGSVSEIYALTGKERDRFERELQKMTVSRRRFVLCEFDYLELVQNPPPGILEPQSVYGTIISFWTRYNIPFFFMGNRANARNFLYKTFYFFVKYEILKIKHFRMKNFL